MPIYSYICKNCDYLFDEFHTVETRNEPTKEPCPACGESGQIEIALGAILSIWKTERSTL